MKIRPTAWFVWFVGGLAFAFASSALLLVELNGGDLGSASATGSAILAVSFSMVGAVILAWRPENPIGWILLVGGFFDGLKGFSGEYSKYALLTSPGPWPGGSFFAWLDTWAFAPGLAAFPLTLLLFPTGRLPSSHWRPILWLVTTGVALIILPVAVAAWPLGGLDLVRDDPWTDEIGGGLAEALGRAGVGFVGLGMLASVISLALRFRRAAEEERQQIKWLFYAGALMFVVLVTLSPAAPFKLSGLLGPLLSNLALLALPSIPVAIGIAILKYRLYDIDLVINRTLVYAVLTAMLAGVYFGGVVLMQSIFRALTGQTSQLAIVASTLAIAALFQPLRRRIQNFIDRRFYRKKYDVAKTLEAFGARLRDETDLSALSEDLVEVVRDTMQPAHVSLWLRPAHRRAEEVSR